MRPNQVDPHEKERQEIAQKFSDSSPKIVIQSEKTSNSTEQPGKSTTEDTYTTFDQVCIYWNQLVINYFFCSAEYFYQDTISTIIQNITFSNSITNSRQRN